MTKHTCLTRTLGQVQKRFLTLGGLYLTAKCCIVSPTPNRHTHNLDFRLEWYKAERLACNQDRLDFEIEHLRGANMKTCAYQFHDFVTIGNLLNKWLVLESGRFGDSIISAYNMLAKA